MQATCQPLPNLVRIDLIKRARLYGFFPVPPSETLVECGRRGWGRKVGKGRKMERRGDGGAREGVIGMRRAVGGMGG